MRTAAAGFLFLVLASTSLGCKKNPAASRAAEPPKVAAAAGLAFAFKDVGDAFEKQTGRKGFSWRGW